VGGFLEKRGIELFQLAKEKGLEGIIAKRKTSKNQAAIDEELFHDIIPFLEARYNVSDDSRERAIAGLSMGGLQSTETGIVHLGYFSWIGAFSPTLFLAISPTSLKRCCWTRKK
jgi:enterochelin esterase-like enzyme